MCFYQEDDIKLLVHQFYLAWVDLVLQLVSLSFQAPQEVGKQLKIVPNAVIQKLVHDPSDVIGQSAGTGRSPSHFGMGTRLLIPHLFTSYG